MNGDNPFNSESIRIQPPPLSNARGRRARQPINVEEKEPLKVESPIKTSVYLEKVTQLFKSLTNGGEVISQETMVQLFKESSLNQQVLGNIWQTIETQQPGVIKFNKFLLSLQYLYLAQNNKPLNKENLTSIDSLPTFYKQAITPTTSLNLSNGYWTIPVEDQQIYTNMFYDLEPNNLYLDGSKAKKALLDTHLEMDKLAQIWSLADANDRGSLVLAEFLVAMHLAKLIKENKISQLPARVPFELAKSASEALADVPTELDVELFKLNQKELVEVKLAFDNLPKLDNHSIASEHCVTHFLKSNLSQNQLAKIWELVSIRQLKELNYKEFEMAMILIKLCKENHPLPDQLPIPVLVKLQQEIENENNMLSNQQDKIEEIQFDINSLNINIIEKQPEYIKSIPLDEEEDYSTNKIQQLNQQLLEMKELKEIEMINNQHMQNEINNQKELLKELISQLNIKLNLKQQNQNQLNKLEVEYNNLQQQLNQYEQLHLELKDSIQKENQTMNQFNLDSKIELGFLNYHLDQAKQFHNDYNTLLQQLDLPIMDLPDFIS